MAQSKTNLITLGLSGKLGNTLIFSQRYGKTIVSVSPSYKPEQSEKQKAQRLKFQAAMAYAKAALQNPETKAVYTAAAKEGQNALNVAVADMMHAPVIHEINLDNYYGKPGDTILIKATDDFMVASVTVEIYDRNGGFIEGGNATANEKGTEWTYTATTGSDDFYGNKVTVKAMDMPANLSEKVQIITPG